MEDEIQAGEDGLYCVGFKNVFALDRAYIQEVFSQYGSVQSVRGSVDGTDTRRWAFVRFVNPEEAVRAITGMRSSPQLCDVNYVKYVTGGPNRNRSQQAGSADVGAGTGTGTGTGVSPLVRADRPQGRSPVRAPAGSGSGQFEVYVGNWPMALEEDDLYGLFEKFSIKALSVRLYKKEDRR